MSHNNELKSVNKTNNSDKILIPNGKFMFDTKSDEYKYDKFFRKQKHKR